MGGHFDAVGFGDPARGFAATRDQLRAATVEGRLLGEAADLRLYALETPIGCGLVAATDGAGFLLNGCPYFRGLARRRLSIDRLLSWEPGATGQGGAECSIETAGTGQRLALTVALPDFGLLASRGSPFELNRVIVGLGYTARALPPDELAADSEQTAPLVRQLGAPPGDPPNRACNATIRGRILETRSMENERSGAALHYFRLDAGRLEIEIVVDEPSLQGTPRPGGHLDAEVWLVTEPGTG
jgi:hypothetical protein